jgi:uncharacterized protein YndB with AHSA1/START domain
MTTISISALAKASKEKTWNAYTAPEHIVNWNFASPDWCCPSASNDLRVGGKTTSRMEAKDGSFGFDFEGVYEEMDLENRYVNRLGDGRRVEVRFIEEGERTRVEIDFEAEQVNSLELQQAGWQAILNNFVSYLEQL